MIKYKSARKLNDYFKCRWPTLVCVVFFLACCSSESQTQGSKPYVTLIGLNGSGASIVAEPGTCALGENGRTEFSASGNWIANYQVKDVYQRTTEETALSSVTILAVTKDRVGEGVVWSNIRPLSWSRESDNFYMTDSAGNLLVGGGEIASAGATNHNTVIKFRNLFRSQVLLGGESGFAIFRSRDGSKLHFLDLDSNSAITDVFQLAAEKGRFIDYGVQCAAEENCLIFGEIEDWRGIINVPVTQRQVLLQHIGLKVDRVDLSGGSEIDFIGRLNNGQMAFLRRGEEFRELIISEAVNNGNEKILNLDARLDLKGARIVANGSKILIEDFFGQTYQVSSNGDMVFPKNSHKGTARTISVGPKDQELQYLKTNNKRPRMVVKAETTTTLEISCSQSPSKAGILLDTGISKAILHEALGDYSNNPNGSRPLVLKFHGGPYSSESLFMSQSDSAFVEQGMDVINVNYPGSPGFGTQYVLSGRKGTTRSLDDAIDLVDVAARISGRTYSDIIVFGGSFGSLHALSYNNKISQVDLRVVLNPYCPDTAGKDLSRFSNPFQSWIMLQLQPSSLSNSTPSCGGPGLGDVMIFVSENDAIVSPDIGKKIAVSTAPSQLIVLEGEPHTPSLQAWRRIALIVSRRIRAAQKDKIGELKE